MRMSLIFVLFETLDAQHNIDFFRVSGEAIVSGVLEELVY